MKTLMMQYEIQKNSFILAYKNSYEARSGVRKMALTRPIRIRTTGLVHMMVVVTLVVQSMEQLVVSFTLHLSSEHKATAKFRYPYAVIME